MALRFDNHAAARRQDADPSTAALVAACLGAVALAVLAGVWAGRALAPERPAPPATRAVHAGAASVIVPGDWRTAPLPSAGIAGLDPGRTAVLAPYSGLPARVVVTFAPGADDPSLLPRPLRARSPRRAPSAEPTRLAGRRVWLYSGLAAGRRDQLMDVTVLPTTAGVLSVGCVSPTRIWSASVRFLCADSIEAISVRAAATLVPTPDLALQLRLPPVLGALDQARVRARAELRRARTPADQGRSARLLAREHAAAAAALRPVAGRSGTAVVERLSSTARAYTRLARAASMGAAPAFAVARRDVERAEAGLARALQNVAARGGARTDRAPTSPPATAQSATTSPKTLALIILVFGLLGIGLAIMRLRERISRAASRAASSSAAAVRRRQHRRATIVASRALERRYVHARKRASPTGRPSLPLRTKRSRLRPPPREQ